MLRDDIDEMLVEPMEEPGIRVSPLTGGLPVSLDINEGIHETQSYTTLLTLLILTIVLCFVFRSARIGILTMIPVATIIIWQPLLMSSGDVNVNIFTAMIGTIVFGIGVDDAIHDCVGSMKVCHEQFTHRPPKPSFRLTVTGRTLVSPS